MIASIVKMVSGALFWPSWNIQFFNDKKQDIYMIVYFLRYTYLTMLTVMNILKNWYVMIENE